MGLFGKRNKNTNQTFMKQGTEAQQSEKVIQQMLLNVEACLASGMPERAFETYSKIVELTPNVTAQYKGTGQEVK